MANMTFGVNLIPKTNNTYTLGNSDYKWQVYLASVNGRAIDTTILPTVSAADDGKFLRVSSGAWAVVELPSANGQSF